jgi:hypothetical protein
MKLSRRIWDLVRAGVAAPARFSGLGRGRSPARLERQLEQIGKSLAQAAAREKQMQDELALAEEEGRERDAVRLRRQLADLAESTDELQKAVDLIEARIEMERERAREREEEVEPRPSPEISQLAEEMESPQTSVSGEKDEEDDLSARRTRLAAPDKK